jgi:hypothetical protein
MQSDKQNVIHKAPDPNKLGLAWWREIETQQSYGRHMHRATPRSCTRQWRGETESHEGHLKAASGGSALLSHVNIISLKNHVKKTQKKFTQQIKQQKCRHPNKGGFHW